MPLYSLVTNDSDSTIHNYCLDGSEAMMPVGAAQTLHGDVNLSGPPDIGGTYDGSTYTPLAKTDYFVIKDGADELELDEIVQVPADNATSKVLTIQKKDGSDDSDKVGLDETVKLMPQSMVVVDKMSLTLDTVDGAEDVTFGPFPTNQRGCVPVLFQETGGNLGSRSIIIEVTD